MWHVTRDTWHMTCDMWHVWHMTHIVGWTFAQNFSTLALLVWDWQCLEDICTNKGWVNQWMNEWVSDGGDCRTAPAAPSLLNSLVWDILKKGPIRTEKDFKGFQFFLVLLSFLYYVSNMTILIGLVLLSSFQFPWVLLYSQKGVNPPQEVFIHQASKVNWSVSIWEYLTSFYNERQRKKDDMTAMKRRKLHFNWWLVRLLCLSSGLDCQSVGGLGDI